MKKSLFFAAAASALMLTACSSESDVVQNTTPQTQTTVQQKAVGFDTYTAGTTRAGSPEGVMTTDKLKSLNNGFGVFAMFQENNAADSTKAPDFMYNEHVHWNGGWTYAPLKYWPNETANDSQSPAAEAATCDGLSFFAYAPYVSTGTSNTLDTSGSMETNIPSTDPVDAYVSSPAQPSGIISIYKETVATKDPLVEWGVSQDPDHNVDLLWGVAPAGMSYKAVNGTTYSVDPGKPLLNLVKPDKDQKMKFLFEHALSRIGLTVVSAIDQIAAGDDGNKYNTAETRVLIDSVKIFGDNIGVRGVLNLNNTAAHVANWIETSVDRHSYAVASPLFDITAANGRLAPDLRYEDLDTVIAADASKFSNYQEGVLKSEKDLMVGGPDPSKKVTNPTYKYGTPLYKQSGVDYVVANATATVSGTPYKGAMYEKSGDNYNLSVAEKTGSAHILTESSPQYYKLNLGTNPKHVTDGTGLDNGKDYYMKVGSGTTLHYDKVTANGTSDATGYYYDPDPATYSAETKFEPVEVGGTYADGDYYTGLLPRYFMVIPSQLSPETATNIKVQISYRVITKDEKLSSNISNVQNVITKSTDIVLKNGKSYNLKLILGLTSVKLDATVADWQVADDTEIWLPKNNE